MARSLCDSGSIAHSHAPIIRKSRGKTTFATRATTCLGSRLPGLKTIKGFQRPNHPGSRGYLGGKYPTDTKRKTGKSKDVETQQHWRKISALIAKSTKQIAEDGQHKLLARSHGMCRLSSLLRV
jgi:hypothetical protein